MGYATAYEIRSKASMQTIETNWVFSPRASRTKTATRWWPAAWQRQCLRRSSAIPLPRVSNWTSGSRGWPEVVGGDGIARRGWDPRSPGCPAVPWLGSARLMVAQSEGVHMVVTHLKRRRFLSSLGYETTAARVQFIYGRLGSCLVDLNFLPIWLIRG
jgi:hypothetical protein